MSQTLFLKYRPQNFADLVGQTSVVKTLKNALAKNKPANAYLFVGSRGTGKTSTARIFAKGLNSFDTEKQDILENELTQQIANGECVDIIEIDAASHTGVDNIRDLIDKVPFLPTYAKRKVYIIDEVHMLSKGAFNALLKTLEEPPAHAFFLLATTEMHKVPDTIVSRCQTFVFGRFTIEQLVDRLQFICQSESLTAERPALEMIAKQAEGGLRDAISLLEQMAAETNNNITEDATRQSLGISAPELLEKFWHAIQAKDTDEGLQVLKQLNKNGADFRTFCHDFLGFLRAEMHANLNENQVLPLILKSIEAFQKAVLQLKSSPIVELPLEIALIELSKRGELAMSCSATSHKTAVKMPTSPIEKPAPIKPKIEKKAEIPPVKTEAATKTMPAVTETGDFTAQMLQSRLSTIAKVAGVPIFVRKSFEKSSPQILSETSLNFSFRESFHLEQVNKPEVIAQIRTAIEEMFGKSLDISMSLGMTSANGSTAKKSKPITKSEANKPASADDFLDF